MLRWLVPLTFVFAIPASQAQSRPSITGTWTYQPGVAPASLPAAPSGVLGTRIGLEVLGDTLVVRRIVRGNTLTSHLALNASRTSTRVPGRMCEGESQLIETAAWEGEALAFTVTGQVPAGGGEPRESNLRRTLRLEGPDRLVVEGPMVQGGQSRVVGSVYLRSNDPMPSAVASYSGASATIEKLAWLGTEWAGTTGQITTEERWTPAASGGMMATARTLRGSALASFEFLCIVERGGTLVYVAMPEGRATPTFFTLTGISEGSATFENPQHDYPQVIRYTRSADGSTLETTISATNGARPQRVSLKKVR